MFEVNIHLKVEGEVLFDETLALSYETLSSFLPFRIMEF